MKYKPWHCDQCGRTRPCLVKDEEYLYDRTRYTLTCPKGHTIHGTQYKQIAPRRGKKNVRPTRLLR